MPLTAARYPYCNPCQHPYRYPRRFPGLVKCFPYLVLLTAALIFGTPFDASAALPFAAKNNLSTLPVIQLKIDKFSWKTYLAIQSNEQTLGLSNIKDDEFSSQEAMLFVYPEVGPRRFWMKDTYFNLDIIFCDSQGKIVALAANMPASHHTNPASIPTTPIYQAQYVLEVKAGTYPWEIGMKLPLPLNRR